MKGIKIAPSILSADFSKLGDEIKKLDETCCDYIHIDVMDGHFVPNLTIGYEIIRSLRPYSKKIFDVHLMINPVKNFLASFAEAGANIITIHHEIEENVIECLTIIKKLGLKAGISIKPKTNEKVLEKYLDHVDLILVMTVEPGFGGQKFIKSQLKKISNVKKIIGKKNIELEVDGGINSLNNKSIIQAGANVLVAGSAIFKNNNYNQNIIELKKF